LALSYAGWRLTRLRSSCAEGIPPLVIAEPLFGGEDSDRDEMAMHLPTSLQFLHKAHIILLRAMSAMVRTDLRLPNCDVNVLRSLISIFDAQLIHLSESSPSELGTSLDP
jgi:transcriptional regulatory protein LEU3